MTRLHSISWVAMATALALASPALATPLPATATVAAASKPVQFEVFLPLRNQADLESLLEAQQTASSPLYHKWLTPAQFNAKYGPTPQSLARVHAALVAGGLQVTETTSRSLRLSGTVGQVNTLFGARLYAIPSAGGQQRLALSAPAVLPTALQQEGARIVGLDNLPPRHVFSTRLGKPQAAPANRYGVTGAYWFDDLKQAYDYPSYQSTVSNASSQILDGTGVNPAVLMADLIFPQDVKAAFTHEKFTTISGNAIPVVKTVTVDGGGVYNGYGSFEASLDVQQITGGAPGSKVTLVSIPDLSDAHIADGYNYIVESNKYDIVNSSFGACELEYTAAYNNGIDYTYLLQIEHAFFQQGNAQGITFVASSGDEGGVLCPQAKYFSGKPAIFVKGVSTPASDPNVTGVGGGNLITVSDGKTLDSKYVRESAYGDTEAPSDPDGIGVDVSGGYWAAGGGISSVFAQPTYQINIKTGSTTFRTVPDVGMQVGGLGFSSNGSECEALSCSLDDSSVLTAFGTAYGGGFYYTIGTSVSSPEFVGALVLYIQKSGGRIGNINPYLYSMGAAQTAAGGVNAPTGKQFYHRNIPGFDGAYADTKPSQNYNYINGNGTPDVRKLLGLTQYAPAGLPQTPSNP